MRRCLQSITSPLRQQSPYRLLPQCHRQKIVRKLTRVRTQRCHPVPVNFHLEQAGKDVLKWTPLRKLWNSLEVVILTMSKWVFLMSMKKIFQFEKTPIDKIQLWKCSVWPCFVIIIKCNNKVLSWVIIFTCQIGRRNLKWNSSSKNMMLWQKEIEELDLASSVCLAWEFITQEVWPLLYSSWVV